MKKKFLVACSGLILLFSSCKRESFSNGRATDKKPDVTAMVALNDCFQKTIGNDNIIICLDSLNDSRCPIDAVCVWQGVATAKFTTSINGTPYHFTLGTSHVFNFNTDTTIQHYKFSLLDVLPHPQLSTSAESIASIGITRL